jgi:hypothetical protein
MKTMAKAALLMGLVIGMSGRVAAQDDPKDVIQKAIAAAGGAENLNKYKGTRSSAKGTMSVAGMDSEFTLDSIGQFPDKQKVTIKTEFNGMAFTIVQLVNGDKVSLNVNGMNQPISDAIKGEVKSSIEMRRIQMLTPLLSDKKYQFKMLSPTKVNDKEAVGIEISAKDMSPVKVYFDKDTHLIVKTERLGLDVGGMGEVPQETILSDYKDVHGVKVPMKMVSMRDGKKFMESTVTKSELLDKVDDSEFSD